jgi:hypothetical protein
MLLFKNQKKSQKHTQNSKKTKKNISFLNQFQILKFLTIKFLWCNIYQISNDNINYVPKQNHSSWLFIQKILKKNQKKVKTQKHKNNSRIAIRLLSYHQNFFLPTNRIVYCTLTIVYFLSIFISTMMYNIFNATEVKTNIPCK